jgi:UDP-2-acetamido-2,6-beta-L-arabino-hexul-4-ose reductase
MKKIGITGKSGFIGTHLSNTLYLDNEKYEVIDIKDEYFNNELLLQKSVNKCDVIVHLAALNRHNDPKIIYETNILLVNKLIHSLELTDSKPHIIFSSSTQEVKENSYGNSKKKGRELFEAWADKYNAKFTALIIPNVFGPFGLPFYNSFIATFSHLLTRNLEAKIDIDSEVSLIFVDELVKQFLKVIESHQKNIDTVSIQPTASYRVSEILSFINEFKDEYLAAGIIPDINSDFKINLFNTFRSYIDLKEFFPFHYKINKDDRGTFIETMKLKNGGQVSFSTTKHGITRGNHFHTRKIERFAVIKGEAIIKLRKINTKEIFEFKLNGDKPSFVDMPIWFTHNITNIGNSELITLFWINEFFNPENPDTYYEKVELS